MKIEQQPVFTPFSEIVEADAEVLQDGLMTLGKARPPRCDKTPLASSYQDFPKTGSAADPQDILQIPKSTGTLLDIGLKIVRDIVISAMPLLLLTLLGYEKRLGLRQPSSC